MADSKNFDVFISYSRRDKNWASKFAQELEAQGVHAWLDVAQVQPGDLWHEKLEEALRDAPVIAVLISPSYVTSPSSAFELGAAVGGNKKIIPILTEQVEHMSLPAPLRDRRLLQEPSPEAAGKVVAKVVEQLTHPNAI